MNTIRYIIKRYELYGDPPTDKVIGFLLECTETNKNEYLETMIPLSECLDKTDNEICDMAYLQIADQIKSTKDKLSSQSNLLNNEFIPQIDVDEIVNKETGKIDKDLLAEKINILKDSKVINIPFNDISN